MNEQAKTAEQAPCFLCGDMVEIKYSKRQKPYLVCNSCGVQVFIRGKTGIALLKNWKNPVNSQTQPASQPSLVLELVGQLEKFKISLKNTEESQSGWMTFMGENPAVDAIKSEIEKIENQLRELAGNK